MPRPDGISKLLKAFSYRNIIFRLVQIVNFNIIEVLTYFPYKTFITWPVETKKQFEGCSIQLQFYHIPLVSKYLSFLCHVLYSMACFVLYTPPLKHIHALTYHRLVIFQIKSKLLLTNRFLLIDVDFQKCHPSFDAFIQN